MRYPNRKRQPGRSICLLLLCFGVTTIGTELRAGPREKKQQKLEHPVVVCGGGPTTGLGTSGSIRTLKPKGSED